MVQTFIGEDMVVDGTEYKLIREPDVLCVVELEGIMPEPLVPSPV
jgi:co-chaperonin GroES (HSP10)